MTPQLWAKIKPIFNHAIELPAQQREAYLRQACDGDEPMRQELQSLLAAHRDDASALDRLPRTAMANALALDPQDDGPALAGQRVGAYRLIERIGRGGMGDVYRAERADEQYLAQVAVKLVRTDSASAWVAARFKSERQLLAALEHRNIARLLDGGTTDAGMPYLVMELVEGQPIDSYCAAHEMGVTERVQLFQQVCAAVSFAHQQLIIHRDLKPGNILVKADGSVKLLDFGIAKLLEMPTATAPTVDATATQFHAMTLDYASPEQVRGARIVSTASDVYSLGVVLFRLLTGHGPYRSGKDSAQRFAEMLDDSEPLRASTLLRSAAVDAADLPLPLPLPGPGPPATLRRQLRGDLDNILAMALRKDPLKRYPSVERFADDLRRYLIGLPVLARGDHWKYRAGKFVTRNKFAVAASVLLVISMLAGIVTTTRQARIATAQTRLARQEADKQRAVQSFLTALFEKNTRQQPDAAKAREMPVRDVLVEASDRVLREFGDTPAVKIEVMNTVARLLMDIDEFDRAANLWRESLRIARQHALLQSDAYVVALIGAATANRLLGNGKEAADARDTALQVLDARGDQTSLLRARALSATIAQLASDPKREIALVTQAVELFRTRYATQPGYFSSMYVLGHLQRTQGDMQGAARRFAQATEVFERSGSKDFTNYGASYAWGALCLMQEGHVAESLAQYAKALPLLRRHAGDRSMFTRVQLGLYAQALHQSGDTRRANELFAEVLTPAALANASVVEFDTAVYHGEAMLAEGRPRAALASVNRFESNWLEFAKRYVPNGLQWLTVRARAQAELGQVVAARATLAHVEQLPSIYDQHPRDSQEYRAAVIEVSLKAGDVATARQALPPSSAPPSEFDISFLQLQIAHAWLLLAEHDAPGAVAAAGAGLDHLDQHAGLGSFPFLRAAFLHARAAANCAMARAEACIHDRDAAIALLQIHQAADSSALRAIRRLRASITKNS